MLAKVFIAISTDVRTTYIAIFEIAVLAFTPSSEIHVKKHEWDMDTYHIT